MKKIRGAIITKKSLENMVWLRNQLLEKIENEIQNDYWKRIREKSVQKILFLDKDIKGRVAELFFSEMKQKDVHSEYFFGKYSFFSLEILNILCISSKEIREEFAKACSKRKEMNLFLYSVNYLLNVKYFGSSFIEGKDENYRKNFQELKELLLRSLESSEREENDKKQGKDQMEVIGRRIMGDWSNERSYMEEKKHSEASS